jgi:pimeloyl-ACP methyl ester carboxylesterase
VGLSFGALVAIDFVLTHPNMVRSLVLTSPAVGGASWSEAMLVRFGQVEDAAERGDLEAALEIENEIWVYGPHRTATNVEPEVRRKMTEMNRLVWQREAEAAGAESEELDPPAAQRLAEIKAPTLVIIGQGDVPDIADRAAMLAREVAGARVESIPEVAHQLNMECPDVFNRLVIDFCSSV